MSPSGRPTTAVEEWSIHNSRAPSRIVTALIVGTVIALPGAGLLPITAAVRPAGDPVACRGPARALRPAAALAVGELNVYANG